MDSPCKIHNLLVSDFYILLSVKVTCAIIVFNAATESLKDFTFIPFVPAVVISLITIRLLQRQLLRRGNKPKIPASTKAVTIPNIELFKILKKHPHE